MGKSLAERWQFNETTTLVSPIGGFDDCRLVL